jgi:hypothetical protein
MHILWHFAVLHPWTSLAMAVPIGGTIIAAIFKAFETVFDAAAEFFLGLFFVKKEVDDLYSLRIISELLNDRTRGYGVSTERYEAVYKHVRPVEGYRNIFYRMPWGTWRLWFLKRRPIILIPSNGGGDDKATFVFFRGTINWERLVIDAAKFRDDRLANFKDSTRRFKIRRHVGSNKNLMTMVKGNTDAPDGTGPETKGLQKHQAIAADVGDPLFWTRDEIGPPERNDPLELLAINPSMQRIIDDVKFWYSHKEWHRKKGIDWKLGINIWGLPGVGKTSIIRALAEELDLPLHTFELASMTTQDFIHAWEESRQDKPRINLIEDFDTVFHGRENIVKGGELSFQTILNTVDGIEREDGLLFIITTNNIEQVDPALGQPDPTVTTEEGDPMSTRPNRIDIVVELKGIDLAGREKIATRILDDKELAKVMASRYDKESAAQFQERCKQLAKKMLWTQAP